MTFQWNAIRKNERAVGYHVIMAMLYAAFHIFAPFNMTNEKMLWSYLFAHILEAGELMVANSSQ